MSNEEREQIGILLKDLYTALNESIADSKDIANAIEKIKKAGFDINVDAFFQITYAKMNPDEENCEPTTHIPPEIQLTESDLKFLRRIKISRD